MSWDFPPDRLFDLDYEGVYFCNCRFLRADSETVVVVRDSAAGTRVETQLLMDKIRAIHARLAVEAEVEDLVRG